MKDLKVTGSLKRRALSDLNRNTLVHIESIFGRLVYISSLRNPNTGRYEHHGMALVFGDHDADRALRTSHSQAFSEWLSFTLEQQKADLALYLASLTDNKKVILETWLRLTPYRNLIPASIHGVEKRLYLSDFAILLELLKNEYGAVSPDPDA